MRRRWAVSWRAAAIGALLACAPHWQVPSALVASDPGATPRRGPSLGHGYPVQPVPIEDVEVTGGFWRARLDTNRTVSLPHILRQNELTGRVANFLRAARPGGGEFQGRRYNDTDVYKAIEAASYVVAATRDPALERAIDALVASIAAAQEPDGYLYTARTVNPSSPPPGAGPERWSWLHTSHELYNAGHLYEAAVAHHRATGKRRLLDVAIRNADLVCRVFGPAARRDAPGHQEIELALVKLAAATGNGKYLEQARFFLDQRGRPHTVSPWTFPADSPFAIYNDLEYRQDHAPVTGQATAVGHAVRATYMYAGMTDVATLLGDEAYARTLAALWSDVTARRAYLTGGLGSKGETEAFGDDYVLPNREAYTETCASIGGMLWYYRMFLRSGDGAFLDAFERTLYNGYLSGVSLRGDRFFYQNPLEADGTVGRQAYFDVACCPANLARLLAQLPGLVYAAGGRELFVNLFVESRATVGAAGLPVRIAQRTEYPWRGRVAIDVDPEAESEFTLSVRLPGWARGEAFPGPLYRFADADGAAPVLRVNGTAVPVRADRGFARISRTWRPGDRVELDLPMTPRRIVAHERVAEDAGKVAIGRGPLVYCAEAADNGGRVLGIRLPADAPLRDEFRADLLGGVQVVTASATFRDPAGTARPHALVAIPYFAWANRAKGEMAVWLAVR